VHETYVIAKRELLERVRSKWFVIVTLLGPLLMIGMMVIPALIAIHGGSGAKIAIADDDGVLAKPLHDELAGSSYDFIVTIEPKGTTDAQLLDQITDREINGFVRVPADALTALPSASYRGDNASNQAVAAQLQSAIAKVVHAQRAAALHLSDTARDFLAAPIHVKTDFTTGSAETSSAGGTWLLGYLLSFIIYMTITLYCVNVMRSVVTEKTSRVMELMVAAVKPQHLMAGKILGVGGAALLQISAWLVMGGLAFANKDAVLHAFGISGGGGNALPPLGMDAIAIVVAYFIIGFFFYSSLFAAVGAMVSSEQDTQQVQMPVTMVLVIGILCFGVITNDPRSSGAAALTTIPLWSPMLMPMRYVLGGASAGDVAISLGVLAVSTAVVVRAAAKIYRVGVLMYGKRPGVMEIVRWLRY
jgi:ABC-2 type transport system permease protein